MSSGSAARFGERGGLLACDDADRCVRPRIGNGSRKSSGTPSARRRRDRRCAAGRHARLRVSWRSHGRSWPGCAACAGHAGGEEHVLRDVALASRSPRMPARSTRRRRSSRRQSSRRRPRRPRAAATSGPMSCTAAGSSLPALTARAASNRCKRVHGLQQDGRSSYITKCSVLGKNEFVHGDAAPPDLRTPAAPFLLIGRRGERLSRADSSRVIHPAPSP